MCKFVHLVFLESLFWWLFLINFSYLQKKKRRKNRELWEVLSSCPNVYIKKEKYLPREREAWPNLNKYLKGIKVSDQPAFEIKDKMLRIDGFIALGTSY